MHGQACVHYKNTNLLYSESNIVDKGNSSSTQVNWSSGCYLLALCANLFALNVILYNGARWEVAKYTRLKNYKLSSLAVYT